jgi:hypothetical protein
LQAVCLGKLFMPGKRPLSHAAVGVRGE